MTPLQIKTATKHINSLVMRLAPSRPYNEQDREDLRSAAWVGLLQAEKRFKKERGVSFSSFYYLRIRGAILCEIAVIRGRQKNFKSIEHLPNKSFSEPDDGGHHQSLAERQMHLEDKRRALRNLVDKLPCGLREVARLRLYYGLPLRVIGKRIKLTESRVSQLLSQVFERWIEKRVKGKHIV